MLLLGSVSVFIFIYFILVMNYYLIIKPFTLVFPNSRCKKWKKFQKKHLFYSTLHAITIEPIIEWMISGYISLKYGLITTTGEVIGRLFGWISIWVVCLFVPISLIYFIRMDF